MPVVPGQTTLGTVRTIVRERADMVNSQFITDAEFNSYINLSYYELYDLLIQKFGDNYFVQTPHTFTTDGTTTQYPLPSDFYKLLGVDLILTQGQIQTLKPFNFSERNKFQNPIVNVYGFYNMRYRLNGNNLWLNPLPMNGQNIKVWYAPRLTALVNDTDILDGISGFEEYIIVDVAIKALNKEESDVSVLMAQKQSLLQRIEAAAANRDAGSPTTVAQTRYDSGF